MKKVVILLGPPGSGKSTQVDRITKRYSLTSISTGDLIRKAAKESSEIAQVVKGGGLVDDRLVTELLRSALSDLPEHSNVVLDGYPRDEDQAAALNIILDDKNFDWKVISLCITEGEALKRLATRFICDHCGKVSDRSGGCRCGGRFIRRQDDEEEVIRHRLSLYESNLAKVRKYFKETVNIDGEGTVDEVSGRIYSELDGYFKKS